MFLLFASSMAVLIILTIIVFKDFYIYMRAIRKGEGKVLVWRKKDRIITLVMWGYVILSRLLFYVEGEIQVGAFAGSSFSMEGMMNVCYNMLLFFLTPRWLILIGMYAYLFLTQRQIERHGTDQ